MSVRGLFAVFAIFFMLKIVDDGGGGGEVDFVIDEDDGSREEKQDPAVDTKKEEERREPQGEKDAKVEKGSVELDEETKKRLEKLDELEDFQKQLLIEKAITDATEAIKQDHPDFDIEKVSSYLKELHEKDPERAEQLNTPAGWELIHVKHFTKDTEGTFDPGRGKADEPFDFEKAKQAAQNGDKKAIAKLFANAL